MAPQEWRALEGRICTSEEFGDAVNSVEELLGQQSATQDQVDRSHRKFLETVWHGWSVMQKLAYPYRHPARPVPAGPQVRWMAFQKTE